MYESGLPFLLLSDPEKKVLKEYDVWKERSMFGKPVRGIERSTYLIDEDGVIIKAFGNRDPDFDQKMHNVLLVYKQLLMQFDENGKFIAITEDEPTTYTISYDEKPGKQAIANTTEDLPPDKDHKTISRNYEYKRLGTVSLLAGIDLQTGEAIPLVKDTLTESQFSEEI